MLKTMQEIKCKENVIQFDLFQLDSLDKIGTFYSTFVRV